MGRTKKIEQKEFFIHLVSDATGDTLRGLAKACLAQFDHVNAIERFWPLVRNERQMERVFDDLTLHPGPVLFTLVDPVMRKMLLVKCESLNVPCLPVLDPLIKGLSLYLNIPSRNVPGLQHAMDAAYFRRVDAIDFALSFDDGQSLDGIEEADVVLVGVSRTSKTPTCVYLARVGIKAANVPYIPGRGLPDRVLALTKPLVVGLTESADRLLQLRSSRIRTENNAAHVSGNAYIDPEEVEREVRDARKLYNRMGWPIIDVTRRSVEETAAEILFLLQERGSDKETAP